MDGETPERQAQQAARMMEAKIEAHEASGTQTTMDEETPERPAQQAVQTPTQAAEKVEAYLRMCGCVQEAPTRFFVEELNRLVQTRVCGTVRGLAIPEKAVDEIERELFRLGRPDAPSLKAQTAAARRARRQARKEHQAGEWEDATQTVRLGPAADSGLAWTFVHEEGGRVASLIVRPVPLVVGPEVDMSYAQFGGTWNDGGGTEEEGKPLAVEP